MNCRLQGHVGSFQPGGRLSYCHRWYVFTVSTGALLIDLGASGIGESFVRTLASAKAFVTIFDIDATAGEALAEQLRQSGQRVQCVAVDVTSWDAQVTAFQSAIEFSPKKCLDIVITAGGIGGPGYKFGEAPTSIKDVPPRVNTKVLDVNLTGTANSVYIAFHYLRLASELPEGKAFSKVIVVVSSFAGYEVRPLSDIYGASKYGVRGLWKCTKGTAAKHGIRMNLHAPGNVPTPMTERAIGLLQEHGVLLGTKESVADAMLRLVADQSITGRAISTSSQGNFDLRDDHEGFNGGIEQFELVSTNEFGIFGQQ